MIMGDGDEMESCTACKRVCVCVCVGVRQSSAAEAEYTTDISFTEELLTVFKGGNDWNRQRDLRLG